MCTRPRAASRAAVAAAPARQIALLAFDTDVEYFQLNDESIDDTVLDIETITNSADLLFQETLGITHAITEIIVRTAEPDPYDLFDPGELLEQFKDHWNANRADVVRDTAHLMTGRNLTGTIIGAAYVGVICLEPDFAYGISQSRFTSFYINRVKLTTHELGHNWAATHCDADPDCSVMCSQIGDCSDLPSQFGTSATIQMNDHRAAVTCLDAELGACCLGDGSCVDFQSPADCEMVLGGTFTGAGGTCRPVQPWSTLTKVLATDGEEDDLFGGAVALSGGTILVGARLEDDGGSNAGAAYVYRRVGSQVVFEQKLVPIPTVSTISSARASR